MYPASIFAIILVVSAGILLVPFHISLCLNADGSSICGHFKAKWFGLISYKRELAFLEYGEDGKGDVGITKFGSEIIADDENAVDNGFETDRVWPLKDPRIIVDAIMAIFRAAKGLVQSIHVEHVTCKVAFGLNDPADTAALCGYLWALTSAVSLHGAYIRVYPHFEGERLAGSLNLKVRGRLLWVFVASIVILREKPIRRLLKELIMYEIASGKLSQIKWPQRENRGKGLGNAAKL